MAWLHKQKWRTAVAWTYRLARINALSIYTKIANMRGLAALRFAFMFLTDELKQAGVEPERVAFYFDKILRKSGCTGLINRFISDGSIKEGTQSPRLAMDSSQAIPNICVPASLVCQSAGSPESLAAMKRQSSGISSCINAWFLGCAPLL